MTPEVLKANLEEAGPEFDVDYCLTKARALLDNPDIDLDVVAWAEDLVSLALVVRPHHRPAKVLKARCAVAAR